MKSFRLGQSDILTSSIIMGTSQAGKTHWVGIEEREIEAAIHAAIDCGINSFDTAEQYGNGESEILLGKTIQEKRKEVALFSKVFPSHLKHNDVIQSCEQSLKNLKTDYIDLYQIHWPSGSWNTELVPLEETMAALNQLKQQGKIRSIGVSNFSLVQLQQVCKLGSIDSFQPPYSLFWRFIENEIHPFCLENQISILAYSPLSQGFLTGRFQLDHQFEPGDHRFHNRLFSQEIFPKVVSCTRDLTQMAELKGLTAAQLALAWVINHPQIGAIVGARNPQQIRENAVAGTVELSTDEMEQIETITWPVAKQFIQSSIIWNFKV